MEWVIKEHEIEVFPHPNATQLELGNVGGYQVVVPIGKYKTGDRVFFLPEKTIIPETDRHQWADSFREYLSGRIRVRSVRLRGELSQGIIISLDELPEHVQQKLPYTAPEAQHDVLMELLEISKYEPMIPSECRGKWTPPSNAISCNMNDLTRHDCEHFNLFMSQMEEGEEIVVTEKVHGSQVALIRDKDGHCALSSKGVFSRGFLIMEDETNVYWKAARNSGVFDLLADFFPEQTVQAFGEVIPFQVGYHYGENDLTLRLFDIRLDGRSLRVEDIPRPLRNLWVPVIYEGPLHKETVRDFAKGRELVSGKSLHIREGVVVRPREMRFAKNGKRMHLKIINPKYKETGEELS